MKHRVPSFNNSTSGRLNRKNTTKKYENVETIEPIDFEGRDRHHYGKSSDDSFGSESEESSNRTSSTSEISEKLQIEENNNNNIEQLSSDDIEQLDKFREHGSQQRNQNNIPSPPPKLQNHSRISDLPRTNSIPKINVKTKNNNGRVMERQKSKSSQIHRNNSLTLDNNTGGSQLNTREQQITNENTTKPTTTTTTSTTSNQLHKQTSSSHRARTSTKTIASTAKNTTEIMQRLPKIFS